MILTPLQKLLKNVGDSSKLIVAKCFKKLPKVQKIANSGHTGCETHLLSEASNFYLTSFRAKSFAAKSVPVAKF